MDTGYGICPSCVVWQLDRGVPQREIDFSYGTAGINYEAPPLIHCGAD
jgi:hypothetical protein